jgi:single-stranded DNA-binding protein
LVLADGRLKTEEWEKDGQKRSKTKLVSDSFGIKTFEKKPDDGVVSQPRGVAKQEAIDDGDIPF